MRIKLARALVKLAAKVDGRRGVTFSISEHTPEGWKWLGGAGTHLTGIKRTHKGPFPDSFLDGPLR